MFVFVFIVWFLEEGFGERRSVLICLPFPYSSTFPFLQLQHVSTWKVSFFLRRSFQFLLAWLIACSNEEWLLYTKWLARNLVIVMVIVIKIFIIKQQQQQKIKTNSFILICKKKNKVLHFLENYIGYSKIKMKQWSHKRGS